jgi:ADP-heptose:LPS heptosyltransferase
MRGKRVAFGDGRTIKWDHHSRSIFMRNPNIAEPGSERARDLEWVPFYKGNRLYNTHDGRRWRWNYDFRVQRGAVYLSAAERAETRPLGTGFVLIEPNVAHAKAGAVNKAWSRARYQAVADALRDDGRRVLQFSFGGPLLDGVEAVPTRHFRNALAILANAALYIGPEGGLHHGAAAVGVPAIVIFSAWIPPAVTGYAGHVNLTGGDAEPCGRFDTCPDCQAALERITVRDVLDATSVAKAAA